ncbi:MAG: hypothetical protein HC913_01015 [Microscillaceae bacterium]|nr:hypothetical protein [Microscillaceae bacterium]
MPDLQDWTATEITPGLAEAGLQKMALLIPHELIANLAVQQTVDEMEAEGMPYETKYFDDEAQARTWLDLAN